MRCRLRRNFLRRARTALIKAAHNETRAFPGIKSRLLLGGASPLVLANCRMPIGCRDLYCFCPVSLSIKRALAKPRTQPFSISHSRMSMQVIYSPSVCVFLCYLGTRLLAHQQTCLRRKGLTLLLYSCYGDSLRCICMRSRCQLPLFAHIARALALKIIQLTADRLG